MPMTVVTRGLAAALLLPMLAGAQGTPATLPSALTVEQAIALAQANNPALRQTLNNRRSAAAATRSAYGQLLPNVGSSASASWREGRQQVFNGVGFGASANTIGSSAGVNASLTYGLDTWLQPKAQKAAERGTIATGDAELQLLRSNVTQQYIVALQAEARAALQDSLLQSNQLTLDLANARLAAGTATQLDVQRAAVALGQQRVQVLQARNTVATEKLTLYANMGVSAPDVDVALTSAYSLDATVPALQELIALAKRGNLNVIARREREEEAAVRVRIARAQYFPQLSLSAGYGGFTNAFTDNSFPVSQALASKQGSCFQRGSVLQIVGQPFDPSTCSAISLTPEEAASARSSNSTFPFSLTRNPYNVSAQFSLPIFNGWQREQRTAEASVARDNARQAVRQQELAAEQQVRVAYLNLDVSRQTAALQEQNSQLARQALLLAETRYRVGQATFIDVSTARADFARAETDRIASVYDFHRAFARLEEAIGRRLR
ncbi:MAG TPA: TolC family protein [Gemmatimonadaceae bacterium]|nr:TolC family protein [Gemmatimonadaceae bacterium]